MYVGAFRIKYLPYVDISFKHQIIKKKKKKGNEKTTTPSIRMSGISCQIVISWDWNYINLFFKQFSKRRKFYI